MNEFEGIANSLRDEHFANLTKISQSMSEAERERYGEINPVRIWMVAGPSEEHAIAISAN